MTSPAALPEGAVGAYVAADGSVTMPVGHTLSGVRVAVVPLAAFHELAAKAARAERAESVLSHITERMWGSAAPTHPDIAKAFDAMIDRAYSTDRAWDHIGKMCESAARKAGDAEAKCEKSESRASSLATALGDAVGRLRSVVDEVRPHVRDGEDARNLREGEAFLSKCDALLDAAGGKGGG